MYFIKTVLLKKNNKFYLYSDNYYIECDENDITNRDFHKILNRNLPMINQLKKSSSVGYFERIKNIKKS